MIRGALVILSFISVIFFPWFLTVALALGAGLLEPLIPFAIGLFADTLYYTPHAGSWPVYTFWGAVASVLAVLVRSRMRTGSIG